MVNSSLRASNEPVDGFLPTTRISYSLNGYSMRSTSSPAANILRTVSCLSLRRSNMGEAAFAAASISGADMLNTDMTL